MPYSRKVLSFGEIILVTKQQSEKDSAMYDLNDDTPYPNILYMTENPEKLKELYFRFYTINSARR
jgi:hypothetical protein